MTHDAEHAAVLRRLASRELRRGIYTDERAAIERAIELLEREALPSTQPGGWK